MIADPKHDDLAELALAIFRLPMDFDNRNIAANILFGTSRKRNLINN
jgi:hypothetical protein